MGSLDDVWRETTRVGPDRGDHRVALRASVSVLVPLLVLAAVGHLEWSIYATFGAFAALYGRERVAPARTWLQLWLAAGLTACVGLGVLVGSLPERRWVAVVVAALVAAVASVASDAQGWHPPGPLFPVFAFGATSSIESQASDVGVAVLVAGCSGLLAVALGSLGHVHRTRSAPRPRPARPPDLAAVARRHVARTAGAALVAGGIATGLGIGHPYWAVVGAVVPLSARALLPQLVRGVQRLIGTALGLLVAAVLLALDPRGLVLVVVVVLLQGVAELLIGRNYALALVAVTPLALLVGHLAAPSPAGPLLADRAVETVVGVAVGVLAGWLTRDRSATPS